MPRSSCRCLTRRVFDLADEFRRWCTDHKSAWRAIYLLAGLAVGLWLYFRLSSPTGIVGLIGSVVFFAVLAEVGDLLFHLPALAGMVLFWIAASATAVLDLGVYNVSLWRVPENRVALLVNAVNAPLVGLLVYHLVVP